MKKLLLLGLAFLAISCGNTENKGNQNYKKSISKIIEGKNITEIDLPRDRSRTFKSIELTDEGILIELYTDNLEKTEFIPYSVIEEVQLRRKKESTDYRLNIYVIKYYDRGY